MKVLLDECVTRKLKLHLPEFDAQTVVEMGWSGLKNGAFVFAVELARNSLKAICCSTGVGM